ncbi:MAG: hypothetical protein EAZ07_03200 [Cytophagales bacterium]|nr:MAG: hypothetical protein EAZ07_03200 [Cytophagales bacterium]
MYRTIIKLIQSRLNFSHREANGFIIILVIMLVALFSPLISQHFWQIQNLDTSKDQIILEKSRAELSHISLQESRSKSNYNRTYVQQISEKSTIINPFSFNPNEASKDDLLKLGLTPKVVNNILKFRGKKGTFKIKKDLSKIYGIDSTTYKKLENYILLPDYFSKPLQAKNQTIVTKTIISKVDINLADTTQLIQLKGIGSKLAARIIKYRNKLGGFINADQYKEVYGLDSNTIIELKSKTFISNDFIPSKINLKYATIENLKKHPYIAPKEAMIIVNYISQHPNFQINDLNEIKILEKEKISKISAYLTFENKP